MNPHDDMRAGEADIAYILSQVVEVGATRQQAELGAAIARDVASRPKVRSAPDPDVVAALRGAVLPEEPATIAPLNVMVDFNDLVSEHGLTEAFDMIGKLKDLLA